MFQVFKSDRHTSDIVSFFSPKFMLIKLLTNVSAFSVLPLYKKIDNKVQFSKDQKQKSFHPTLSLPAIYTLTEMTQ